jgi:small-conductance mechanosensitive channel
MVRMSVRILSRYSAVATIVPGLLLGLILGLQVTGHAATAAATGAASATVTPTPKPQVSSTPASTMPDDSSVISFLGDVINWSRGLALEDQIVEQPSDVLSVSQDKYLAGRVVTVAFEFARAEAALLAALGKQAPTGATDVLPSAEVMQNRGLKLEAEFKAASARVTALKAELATAPRRKREALARQLAGAQGDLELAQARLDFFNSIGHIEKNGAESDRTRSGLLGRIAALEQSLPQKDAAATPSPADKAMKQASEPSGVFAHTRHLLAMQRSMQAIGQRIDATNRLRERAQEFHQSLERLHEQIDARVQALAGQAVSGADGDSVVLKGRKKELESLQAQHTLVAKGLPPLGAEAAMLKRYATNLGQWRDSLKQRSVAELRSLVLWMIGLGLVLGAIFAGAMVWRKLTFHYVRDLHRRHQLLQLRTLAVAFFIALVLLFNFTSELGTIATVMGFAAAGIAFALQNVILSLAGHFYLTGRFGVRVGDRVELGGVRGDVISIGMVKLTLMELSGESGGRQPTGRVVVIPNSIVFQPHVNFFKQAPGTSFMWNELRLALAPDCDYRLAEKRLMEVVEQVFDRYRETVHRQCRVMERQLHVGVEPPSPQCRLRLSQTGIEMVIRYPVEVQSAVQVADEVSRRLLDTIKQEPGLRLVTLGSTPTIQAGAPASSGGGGMPEDSEPSSTS